MGKVLPAVTANRTSTQDKKILLKDVFVLQVLCTALILLNLLLIYGIFFSSKGILGYRQQSQQVSELNAKVQKLREDNHKLFRKIQSFKTDPSAQERLVREKLGWVRDKEVVIEFVQPSGPPPDKP